MVFAVELYDEAEAAIKRWGGSGRKPPFSSTQLAAIALLVNRRPMTGDEIVRWIKETFKHYENVWERDTRYFMSVTTIIQAPPTQSELQLESIEEGLQHYDLPARESPGDRALQEIYTLAEAEASIYLRKCFEGNSQGTFPFFKLPPELRETIYQMVFGFPPSGLMTGFRYRSFEVTLKTITKDFSCPSSFQASDPQRYNIADQFTLPPLKSILAPLLVNKQVFAEAVSCFYRTNTFYFYDIEDLHQTLSNLPPSRRQHLGHIAFRYRPVDARRAAAAFKVLATVKHLRRLDIQIDEGFWMTNYGPLVKGKIDILRIPGMGTLRKMRGLREVVVHGCDRVDVLLNAEMKKPSR